MLAKSADLCLPDVICIFTCFAWGLGQYLYLPVLVNSGNDMKDIIQHVTACRTFFGEKFIVGSPARRQLFLLAILFLSASPIALFGQRYVEIDGEVESLSYPRHSGVPTEQKIVFPFKCIVGKDKWRIKHEWVRNGINYVYFDGTNINKRFQMTRESPQRGKMGLATVPFEQAKSIISISIFPAPDGHPLDTLGANMPWLAFCSGSYLKRPGRIVPLPTAILRVDPDSFAYVDNTETFQDELSLPKTIELFTSTAQYEKSLHDERLNASTRGEREKLHGRSQIPPDGQLRFRYEVVAQTNISGWILPTKFTYTTYQAKTLGDTNVVWTGTGRVIHMQETKAPEDVFVYAPDRAVTIADRRFRDKEHNVNGITYMATNLLATPSMDEPRLQAVFKKAVERARMLPNRTQRE